MPTMLEMPLIEARPTNNSVAKYTAGAHHQTGNNAIKNKPIIGRNSRGSARKGWRKITFVRQNP